MITPIFHIIVIYLSFQKRYTEYRYTCCTDRLDTETHISLTIAGDRYTRLTDNCWIQINISDRQLLDTDVHDSMTTAVYRYTYLTDNCWIQIHMSH